ncbi:MAG: ExbD/TolR family protein [Phycisphaerae bacterium]
MQDARTSFDFIAGADDYKPKLQLAPVVDLVLFLIWFYLLVGQFVVGQKDPAVELPAMANALGQGEVPAELVINLREDSRITIDGADVDPSVLDRYILDQIARAREAKLPLSVVVRADRRQSFARLDAVLQSCRRSGLTQVVFRAKEAGET